MTPIRVRGKRNATPMEKWNHGKQRKAINSRTLSERSSSVLSSSSTVKSSKRRERDQPDPHLSGLEQLPTEILSAIFEFSMNPDLPLTSPRLASQLESRHLYQELTCNILYPVTENRACSHADLKTAMRLMNSKFFTWQFFRTWLYAECEARGWLRAYAIRSTDPDLGEVDRILSHLWDLRLHPNSNLLPPEKLLKGPFTESRVTFLRILTPDLRMDPPRLEPLYAELAREGLVEAIAEGKNEAFESFWKLGVRADTEIVRQAVFDAGCEKEIVSSILKRALEPSNRHYVDFLDTDIWAWAEKARERGDVRGKWLIDELKKASRSENSKRRKDQR